MSEFKVGDKVYLEGKISEYDKSDNTYCIAYSNYRKLPGSCWVKDDILHPADDACDNGLNAVWELAKRIILPPHMGGYTADEFKNIFGKNKYMSAMYDFTPQESLAKVKEYEERNEIQVGDVVKFRGDCIGSIVTKVDGYIVYRLFKDGSCNLFHYNKGDLVKTGHFDSIDEFMRSADD